MQSTVLIINPQTDGGKPQPAEITLQGAWIQIACRNIVIKVQTDDIELVTEGRD